MLFRDPDRPHLGGYMIGGDEDTNYPDLWRWLVRELRARTVLDIGCGDGVAVRWFGDELGCDVLGIDGVAQEDDRIIEHDFTTGPFPLAEGHRFDLGWSCEFVEHVEEEFVGNFLAAFERCDVLLMTHAWPGQAGYHHVNCRTAPYWKGLLATIGHVYDDDLTLAARAIANRNPSVYNHFVRSGIAFRHASTLGSPA